MRAPGWVVVALVAAASGTAFAQGKVKEPVPFPVDVNPKNETMTVLKDGNGGTYVVVGERASRKAFYGTGKQLYEQISIGGSADGSGYSVNVWSPRIPEFRPGQITRRKDGTFFKSCDGLDDAVLTELTDDKAKAALDKVQFLSPALARRPHMLARDDMGIYYYVDRLSERYGGKAFRVFVGKRGAMKQLPLVDIAQDSAGEVFSTKTGDLRLVNARGSTSATTSTWIKGSRKTELIVLDLDVNSVVIFKELGIYKMYGGICDNV